MLTARTHAPPAQESVTVAAGRQRCAKKLPLTEGVDCKNPGSGQIGQFINDICERCTKELVCAVDPTCTHMHTHTT